MLAEAYVASKEKAGEVAGATVHKSLQVKNSGVSDDASDAVVCAGSSKLVRDPPPFHIRSLFFVHTTPLLIVW